MSLPQKGRGARRLRIRHENAPEGRNKHNPMRAAKRALGESPAHRPRLKGATARSIRRRAASRLRNRSCAFQARVPFVPQPQAACRRMGLFLFRISCGSVAQADGRQRESAYPRERFWRSDIPVAFRKPSSRKFPSEGFRQATGKSLPQKGLGARRLRIRPRERPGGAEQT